MQPSALAEILASLSEADGVVALPVRERVAVMLTQHRTLRESLRSLLAYQDGLEQDRREMRTLLQSLGACVKEYRPVPGTNGLSNVAQWNIKPGYAGAVRSLFARVMTYLEEIDS